MDLNDNKDGGSGCMPLSLFRLKLYLDYLQQLDVGVPEEV